MSPLPPQFTSPIDADTLALTMFTSYAADSKEEHILTLPGLAQKIAASTATAKERLPWLKLARFGQQRTEAKSLRHDANVLEITGVEADYDRETITFDQAVDTLGFSGVKAIAYTSPSHTPEKPRWRVLCPTSRPLPPDQRTKLLNRLNGLFRGIFSGESWTLSQSYYLGSVNRNPAHQVEVFDGIPIDLMDELDATAIGKPQTEKGAAAGSTGGKLDEAATLAEIVSGASFHFPCVRLLGKWAVSGVALLDAKEKLKQAFEQIAEADRDDRWKKRFADIDRCLLDIYGKQAKKVDAGEDRGSRGKPTSTEADPRWPEPLDFLAREDRPAPTLTEQHIPAALFPFVTDTAERMGVDPAGVALGCIVACASVASDEWKLQPKRFDTSWTESPRLWGAIVGDPSILKSPVIAACTRPIDLMEAEARRNHAADMQVYRQRLKAAKADKTGGTPDPAYPRLDRYLIEGATVEAISEVLRDDDEAKHRAPAGKLLSRHDEMSEFFGNLDRYKAGGRGGGDRGAYLRLFNGGAFTVDRVMRGSFCVPNWSACFLGGIQPGPIQRIARDAADDGLLQRFVMIVPGVQRQGSDRSPDLGAGQRYAALFPALRALNPLRAPDGRHTQNVALHEAAHRHRETVESLARAMAALPDTSARLKSAFGKWPGLFARLALTFHLLELADARARNEIGPPELVISPETAERAALFILEIALPHLLRADAVMYSTAQTGHAKWIAGWILSRGLTTVASRDVARSYREFRAPEARRDLADTMASLVAVGWLEPEMPDSPARPISLWHVNPAVHTMFADFGEKERQRRDEAKQELARNAEAIRNARK